MDALAVMEAIAGGALLFVLPGFTVAKAVFPERRVAGREGVRWALELAALTLVLSVVLTVTVGYLLLTVAPGGFSASWNDPLLEIVLAAIGVVAFAAGWLEGAYDREPPTPQAQPPEESAGAWELGRELDRLQRERRTLERELRRSGASDRTAQLRERLDRLVEAEQSLRRGREAEYDL